MDKDALGSLHLKLHEGNRAWKGPNFAIFDRLHEAGFIIDPTGRAKSVSFTNEGLLAAEAAWRKLLTRD